MPTKTDIMPKLCLFTQANIIKYTGGLVDD